MQETRLGTIAALLMAYSWNAPISQELLRAGFAQILSG
jgi:hypothetical protein